MVKLSDSYCHKPGDDKDLFNFVTKDGSVKVTKADSGKGTFECEPLLLHCYDVYGFFLTMLDFLALFKNFTDDSIAAIEAKYADTRFRFSGLISQNQIDLLKNEIKQIRDAGDYDSDEAVRLFENLLRPFAVNY